MMQFTSWPRVLMRVPRCLWWSVITLRLIPILNCETTFHPQLFHTSFWFQTISRSLVESNRRRRGARPPAGMRDPCIRSNAAKGRATTVPQALPTALSSAFTIRRRIQPDETLFQGCLNLKHSPLLLEWSCRQSGSRIQTTGSSQFQSRTSRWTVADSHTPSNQSSL